MNNFVLAITCVLSILGAYFTADSGGGINFVPRLEGGMKGPVGIWSDCSSPGPIWRSGIY